MKLIDEAKQNGATPPTNKTLRTYGLTQTDWLRILKRQKWGCAICKISGEVLWNIDHEHIAGWSRMPDKDRSRHVRGILCFRCNRYNAPSRMTGEEAHNLKLYITRYEKRRDNASGK